MRLKSLEMKGFKSFAEKTVVHFGEDVIGVVGSNGCGKSNIVDAIRWVLGEQKTKQLRSESMTNVIFNGTKQRKAAGLAEVSLSFENDKGILPTEYNEVAIKRILYKDGSSEYRLNEVKCRLKDIQNLLSDTGISSDSYAIIALGMVDELLQDKENARSKLFEQAAGISKYKVRKKETLSKLKQTDEDLERVEDLLEEMHKNLKVLERQAKRARKYMEIKEAYHTLSMAYFVYRIDRQKRSYQSLEKQITQEEEQAAKLRKTLEQSEEALRKEKNLHLELEELLQERQRQLQKLTGRIKTAENELNMKGQKNLFIEENNERLRKNLSFAEKQSSDLHSEESKYSEQVEIQEEQVEDMQALLDEAKIETDALRSKHGQAKAELDEFLARQQRQQQRIFEAERRISLHKDRMQNNEQRIRQLQSQVQERQSQGQELQDQSQELQSQLKGKEELLAKLNAKEQERQGNLEIEEENLQSSQEQLRQATRSLDAKQNEYKLLKGLVESLEGFSESIKFLNKNRSWSQQAPLLSDVFYCQEPYRKALENYLDKYLGFYVVEDVQEALDAISLLDTRQKGKANFFILSYLDQKKQEVLQDFPANSKLALDVLEIEEKYQALAQRLLRGVLLVENAEDIPLGDTRYTWLSMDGKRSQDAAILSGGSSAAFEGKTLGRKKNLERLGIEIEALQEKVARLRQEEQRQRNRCQELKSQNYLQTIRKEEQALQQLHRQEAQVKSRLEQFEQFFADNSVQQEEAKKQIALAKEAIQEAQDESEALQELLLDIQEEIEGRDQDFRSMAESLNRASSAYNQRQIELIRLQNALGASRKELQFLRSRLKELEQQQKQDSLQLESAAEELEKNKAEIARIEKQLKEDYEDRQLARGFLADAEQNYMSARKGINEKEEELKQAQRSAAQQSELIHQLQQKFTEVKMQLSNIGERLQSEFEMQLSELLNKEPDPQYNEPELEKEVGELRKKFQNFGPVNSMALESYEELAQRVEFIEQQRTDLSESKQTLMQTMSEIEEKATSRFLNAFGQVREHFIRVFRSLFLEDDTCDLVLANPENPLESAIEIIAKPKGKRPLSINQLSGGEKTLTATALLFALYLLKPAPFCIFDEVDAPLDDANISKFNNIIKEFSKNSQFIIVTHNKKTMEAVDIMYGVTMVQGVSRVIPVDFRSLAEVDLGL